MEYLKKTSREKKKYKFSVFPILLGILILISTPFSAAFASTQQKLAIQGKVVDTDNEPLTGVNIIEKGNLYNGTITDFDGNFKLEVNPNSVLLFSFIGFENKEVTIANGNAITVILTSDLLSIDEVIITGYQKIEKRKLSSSVVSIKGKDVLESGAFTVDNMLQGKVAGLAVMNPTSTPGAAPKIRIRGASSISGNREPVWVIDGVIMSDPVQISAQELNSFDKVNLIGNAVSGLNPSDIERIDILKDASATAIYGIKAANGVIVITTKRGKAGKMQVQFSSDNTVKLRPDYANLDRMNSLQRIEASKEMYERGLTFTSTPGRVSYEGALLDLFDGIINQSQFTQRVQQMSTANTDWYDQMFETSLSTKNNLSISGGSDKFNYYYSLGYAKDNANLKNTGVSQYNARTNLNFNINEKLKIGVKLSGSSSEKDYQHGSIDAYQYAYETSRAIQANNPDGSPFRYVKRIAYDKQPLFYNVNEELSNTGRNIALTTMSLQTTVDYKLTSDLTIMGLAAVNKSNTKETQWANERSYYVSQLRGLNYGDPFPTGDDLKSFQRSPFVMLPYGGELKANTNTNTSTTGRFALNYMKRLNYVHELSANVGGEVRSSKYDGISASTRGYLRDRGHRFAEIDPRIWKNGYAGWLSKNYPTITDNRTNILSAFGTLTYTYDDRYTGNFNIRTDASNKFGQDKSTRFLPVWSASGRWNLSNETFLSQVSWINLLAIKGSYGVQGNVSPDQTPSLIASLGNLEGRSGEYITTLVKLPNPNLRWEKTISTNLALEFALFNGRLSGDLAIYKKLGEDQIITKRVSSTTGANTVTLNGGNIENKGWEFTINSKIIDGNDFKMGASLNAFFNDNQVVKSGLNYNPDNQDQSYQNYYKGDIITVGKPIGGFYSYRFDKLDENGLPLFKGMEETDGITYNELINNAFTYSGKAIADFNGGFSTYFTYKGFSVDLDFAFSVGRDIRLNNLYKSKAQRLPRPEQNMSSELINRWRTAGDENNTNIPVLTNDPLSLDSYYSNRDLRIANNKWEMYNYSDLRVVSGDFLRLRNLRFRYQLPKSVCSKIFIETISVRGSASNLWVLADKELKGRDPEQVTLGSGTVPLTKSFSFGFDVTF